NVVNDEEQLNTSTQITEIDESGPIVHYSSQAFAHQDNNHNHAHRGMTQISNQASYQTTPQAYPIQFSHTSLQHQDNNLLNHQNQIPRFNDTSQILANNLRHNADQFPEVRNQNISMVQEMLPHAVLM
ncbi:43187_t:CDS:1, partial [Gigaspora margarita]